VEGGKNNGGTGVVGTSPFGILASSETTHAPSTLRSSTHERQVLRRKTSLSSNHGFRHISHDVLILLYPGSQVSQILDCETLDKRYRVSLCSCYIGVSFGVSVNYSKLTLNILASLSSLSTRSFSAAESMRGCSYSISLLSLWRYHTTYVAVAFR
jgi:hypothetical protein